MQMTLKAARVNCGLSCRQAAAHLGISINVLYNIERGHTLPRALLLREMLQLYGICFEDLCFLPHDSVKSNLGA